MHVVLKPLIKMMIWIAIIMGVSKYAGVDIDSLVNGAKETLEGLTQQQEAEE